MRSFSQCFEVLLSSRELTRGQFWGSICSKLQSSLWSGAWGAGCYGYAVLLVVGCCLGGVCCWFLYWGTRMVWEPEESESGSAESVGHWAEWGLVWGRALQSCSEAGWREDIILFLTTNSVQRFRNHLHHPPESLPLLPRLLASVPEHGQVQTRRDALHVLEFRLLL